MKILIHSELKEQQKYSCKCCGAGCRSFLVAVRPQERQAIEAQENWRESLGVDELFVTHRAAGKLGFGLAKRTDGSCIFLGNDNLCVIHKKFGLKAKPLACQLYPFVLTPVGGRLHLGLRFDCPAVCENIGQNLDDHRKDLKRMARELITADIEKLELPEICFKQKVSVKFFEAINEILLKMTNSDAVPLNDRLQWLRNFVDYLCEIKWQNVTDENFDDLVGMIQGGLLAEIQSRQIPKKAVTGKPRKLLGQIFFLLCQPTSIITAQKKGPLKTLKNRLRLTRMEKQLRQLDGPLPRIQPDWPDCNLQDLETDFGTWPAEVQQLMTRYLTCRIAGMGYCGYNFYRYSLTEGIQSLLLGVVTAGWVMRIAALQAGRKKIELADAQQAVMTIDGNLGYAQAFGMGPSRMRLEYLSNQLEGFINWFCS